jgi:hypothetical protein
VPAMYTIFDDLELLVRRLIRRPQLRLPRLAPRLSPVGIRVLSNTNGGSIEESA